MSNDGGIHGYTFQWKIENISHCCWLKLRDEIESPVFKANAMEGTEWSLRLRPMGYACQKFVGLFLARKGCSGPTVIEVNYQLAFLGKDGSVLTEKFLSNGYRSKHSCGSQNFESRERIFFAEKDEFVPEDALTVRCTVWKKNENRIKFKHLYARTVFKVSRRSFVWRIDNFSFVGHCFRKKFEDNLIDFDIVLNVDLDKKVGIDTNSLNENIKYVLVKASIVDSEGKDLRISKYFAGDFKKGVLPQLNRKLDLDVISFDDSIRHISFNISIIDSDGKKKNLAVPKYFASDLNKGVLLPMALFPQVLMKNKGFYLPNDVLSLDFEYVYSTETKLNEFSDCRIISPPLAREHVESKDTISLALAKESAESRVKPYVGKETSQTTGFLIEDLKSMYYNGIFSDTQLLTAKGIFPAHKNILSARSPVFRRMFIHDLKNCEHVDITDLEDDTAHRMLLYLYTDILEDLQIESACKLYAAADKFEIVSLKGECSSFLKNNLSPTKACDVLILADRYQDDNLKSAMHAYILEHDEVFNSSEWEHFIKTNPPLAADIMYRKIKLGMI